MPALLNLRRGGLLPDAFAIVAVARTDVDEAGFRETPAGSRSEPSFATPALEPAERDVVRGTHPRTCAAISRTPTCTSVSLG